MPLDKVPFNNNFELQKEFRPVSKKAIYTGAIASAASYLLLGEKGELNTLGNMSVPSSLAIGACVGVGSVVSDLGSDYLISMVDQSASVQSLETTGIKLGVAGLASVTALKLASGVDPSVVGFGLGAGSKAAGDYTYNNLDNALLGMLF